MIFSFDHMTDENLDFLKSPSSWPLATLSLAPSKAAASRPNKFYPEIHEVDLWQV